MLSRVTKWAIERDSAGPAGQCKRHENRAAHADAHRARLSDLLFPIVVGNPATGPELARLLAAELLRTPM